MTENSWKGWGWGGGVMGTVVGEELVRALAALRVQPRLALQSTASQEPGFGFLPHVIPAKVLGLCTP